MADAGLTAGGAGEVVVSGVLDFASVPRLWPELKRLIEREPRLELSLADVTSSNSAALGLLLEAAQLAVDATHELGLRDVPSDLVDLAVLSGLDRILDLPTPSR